MYNLVIVRNNNGEYFFSVFDFDHSLMLKETDTIDNFAKKMLENGITFANIIHANLENHKIIGYLYSCGIIGESTRKFASNEFEYSQPLAGESRVGYGFARYIHRNFLSSKLFRGETDTTC